MPEGLAFGYVVTLASIQVEQGLLLMMRRGQPTVAIRLKNHTHFLAYYKFTLPIGTLSRRQHLITSSFFDNVCVITCFMQSGRAKYTLS